MIWTKLLRQFAFGLQFALLLGLFSLGSSNTWWTQNNKDLCESNKFSCLFSYRGECIFKHKWCDGNYDCGGNYNEKYDEKYCSTYNIYGNVGHNCDESDYYTCDNGACIPLEGRCDGLPSCADGSDEQDCGCEEKTSESGTIDYIAYNGWKRYLKCWKINVPPNKYLTLKFSNIDLIQHGSTEIMIAVKWKSSLSKDETIIIYPHNQNDMSILETYYDTEISFKSIPNKRMQAPTLGTSFSKFSFNYSIADMLCKRADVFRCSEYNCIMPEKKCDGVKDCLTGFDELRCERGVFTVDGVNKSRNLGLNWLKNQRNGAWGWGENTHRAIVAMYLAQGANFNGTNKEEELTAKQLELKMSTAILRNDTDPITPTQLSMYINALLVICHDPRNFYGYNLIDDLKKRATKAKMIQPLSYLALCNAKEEFSEHDIDSLTSLLNKSSDHTFITDIQAVVVIALSCIAKNKEYLSLKENITAMTNRLKEQQLEDGSFGNIYTTALIVQALIASHNEEAKDWNLKAAVEFLKRKQNQTNDGSFGDFLSTYLILPILNGKSLADISEVNCTEKLKMPRDGNPISDIQLKLGGKISVHYSLYIGENMDQVHPIFLRIPENSTVLEVMRLAAEADPKYRFEYQNISGKVRIFKISEISNDPEDGKFWLLYIGQKNSTLELSTKSADIEVVKPNDKIVMWYKYADTL